MFSQKKYALFIILLFGVLIRFFIFRLEKEHIVNYWDSINYGRIGFDIASKRQLSDVLNAVRPPLYPLIIAGSYLVTNTLPTYKDAYVALKETSGLVVVWVQIITGVTSLGVMYVLLRRILNPMLSFGLGLVYAIHPLVFPWDAIILTESLSFSILIFYLYAVVLASEKFTVKRMLFLTATGLVLTWMRSSFVLMLPIALMVIVLKNKNWKTAISAYIACVTFFLPMMIHIHINEMNYGYRTFQVHGEINIFGRMTSDKYTIPKIPDNRISEWMQKNFVLGQYHTPIPILEALDIDYYHNKPLIDDMKEYTTRAMMDNFPAYVKNVFGDIPELFRVAVSLPKSPKWFNFMQEMFVGLQAVASLSLIMLPKVVKRLWQKKETLAATTTIAGVSIVFVYATSLFFGYTDSWRYSTSVIPMLLLYCGGLTEMYGKKMWHKIKIRLDSNH